MKYKYRCVNDNSFRILQERKIYFSSPSEFNDPYDCCLNISHALEEARLIALQGGDKKLIEKLNALAKAPDFFKKIDSDVAGSGVFSLSKTNDNILMWAHYADSHRGFCIGFDFYKRFQTFNGPEKIIGMENIKYYKNNPYLAFLRDFFKRSSGTTYNDFWQEALIHGLISKSFYWRYEKETRIIRGVPGSVDIRPDEIREIIFGLRIDPKEESKIRKILAESAFDHVLFKRVARKGTSFKFEIADA